MFPFLYYILVVSNLFKDRGLKFILPKRFYESLLRSNFLFQDFCVNTVQLPVQ